MYFTDVSLSPQSLMLKNTRGNFGSDLYEYSSNLLPERLEISHDWSKYRIFLDYVGWVV